MEEICTDLRASAYVAATFLAACVTLRPWAVLVSPMVEWEQGNSFAALGLVRTPVHTHVETRKPSLSSPVCEGIEGREREGEEEQGPRDNP